jgi:hypothetical protein
VLKHIVEAAQVMDTLFTEQVWAGNPPLFAKLSSDTSLEGPARLHYFLINKGPWSRLDHNQSFLPAEFGVPQKPGQANYYPADATKEEIDTWINSLKGEAKAQATGFFTVIRRGSDGKLTTVPYSVEYKDTPTGVWTRLADVVAKNVDWNASVNDPSPGTNRFYRLATPKK